MPRTASKPKPRKEVVVDLVKIRDGLYVPRDFENNHAYYADPEGQKPYTGITTIIGVLAKPALIGWAAKMACEHIRNNAPKDDAERNVEHWLVSEELLEEARTAHTRKKEAAGTHGTDMHALVENYINDCLLMGGIAAVPMGETAKRYEPIKQFTDWALTDVDHFLFSERRMANPELFIAGTADFAYIGKDGKKYMADLKTSSGMYGIDYFLQVAAYRLLAEAEGDTPYDGTTIVRLGKDGSFDVHKRFDYATDKEAFLSCLTLYRAQQTFVKPKSKR